MSVFRLGLAQLSVKKVFAVSSMNNVSWIVLGTQVTLHAWCLYLTIYALLLIPALGALTISPGQYVSHRILVSAPSRVKISLVLMLMSLGGLPPFLGFFNKLLIIKLLFSLGYVVLTVIIFRSLVLLYYYLSWSFFILTNGPSGSKPGKSVASLWVVFRGAQRLVLIPVVFAIPY